MKRILLLLVTNFAILFVASVSLRLLGIEPWLSANGISFNSLLVVGAVIGFGGAFVSLAISKWVAKRMMGVRLIEQPRGEQDTWLVETVRRLASQAGIGMPEVGVFESPAPNAFESRRPLRVSDAATFESIATAAITMGPIEGPRPASSMPSVRRFGKWLRRFAMRGDIIDERRRSRERERHRLRNRTS